MTNGELEKHGGVGRFEAALRPCISVVYGDSYRLVLKRVIEIYKSSDGAEGASFYRLYREGVLKSKNMLERVLKTLSECGYVLCRERRARTNSPKGRRDCYPTPLGLVVNKILEIEGLRSSVKALLDQARDEIRKAIEELYVFYYIDYFVEKLYVALPNAYILTMLNWPQKMTPPHIEAGHLTALYAIEQLRIILNVASVREALQEPSVRESFIKNVEDELREELENLRDKIRLLRVLSYRLNRSEEREDVDCMILNAFKDLEELYEDLLKYLESSQSIKNTAQVRT
jgi:DNA-binding transcriptional MerR regulator